MNIINLCILFTLFTELALCVNYCSQPMSCGNVRHTLCLYRNDSLGSQCLLRGETSIKITPDIIAQILSTHNGLRNRIAGNNMIGDAAGMNFINWDHHLEASAKRWGNQCLRGKDPCRKYLTKADFPKIETQGQNSGQKISSILPREFASLIIRDWWREGLNYTTDDLRKLPESKSNDFSQLIWAKARKVGCAAYRMIKPRGYRLVCNYDVQQQIGEEVYALGEPCSDCVGTVCNSVFLSLCGRNVYSNGFINKPTLLTYFLLLITTNFFITSY